MPSLTERAAQGLGNRILLKSLVADLSPETAAGISVLYAQMALVWMTLREHEVTSWKVGLLGSKADALAMRAIASIVKDAVNRGERLPHASVLRDTYEEYAIRTPKANDYIDPIPWDEVT